MSPNPEIVPFDMNRAEAFADTIGEILNAGAVASMMSLGHQSFLADLLFMLARYEDRELPFEVLTGARVKGDSG